MASGMVGAGVMADRSWWCGVPREAWPAALSERWAQVDEREIKSAGMALHRSPDTRTSSYGTRRRKD